MINKKLNKKGFTLTELIVVIVIIGILAAVLIPTLTGYIKKANQSADEQEVANLNKIVQLYDYEDTKPTTVKELKTLLKEEGYKGDYTLKVDGNYLWYDVKENRFVILKESEFPTETKDVVKLAAVDTENYKLSTNLLSPEGLLNNNGSEVLLVGGKGELISLVNYIRNLGDNTSANLAKELNGKIANLGNINATFKSSMQNLIENSVFYGENGSVAFEIQDGNLVVTENYENKNSVLSTILNEAKDFAEKLAFNNNVILANLDKFNEDLAGKIKLDCATTQNVDGSFNFDVTIQNQDTEIMELLTVFINILNTLYENDVKEFYLSPILNDGTIITVKEFKEFLNFEDEENYFPLVLQKIEKNENGNYDEEDSIVVLKCAFLILYSLYYEDGIEFEQLDSKVNSDIEALKTGLKASQVILNKSSIRAVGVVEKDGKEYEIVYNFNFIQGYEAE